MEKMNPITVQIHNVRSGKIVHRYSEMCETTSATGEALHTVLNEKISQLLDTSKPRHEYDSVGTNNTSTNIGIKNSLKIRIIACNDSTYSSGCPCHIIHNVIHKRWLIICMQKQI